MWPNCTFNPLSIHGKENKNSKFAKIPLLGAKPCNQYNGSDSGEIDIEDRIKNKNIQVKILLWWKG